MKIHIFLKKSMFIFLIISKKLKLKKSSEVKFYSSNFKSSYIFIIVHLYPSLISSSGNSSLLPKLEIE